MSLSVLKWNSLIFLIPNSSNWQSWQDENSFLYEEGESLQWGSLGCLGF